MKTQLRSIIKVEIEEVFGRRVVSSRDCIELSDEIYDKTKERLNQNTLRRFFGLVKSEYPPSQSTLSILSKYCGFQSLDDAYKVRLKDPDKEETALNIDSVLHYLVSIFKDVPLENVENEAFLNLVKQTVQFINSSEGLGEKFQSHILRTDSGSRIYFEKMINIDKINDYYGSALRYYLKEKGTVEAEIFTDSLYVFRHWLNNEDMELERIAPKLTNALPRLSNHLMYARHFAAVLLCDDALHNHSNHIKRQMEEYFSTLTLSVCKSTEEYLHYCYIMAAALALTGEYALALHYIEKAPKMVIDPTQDQSIHFSQSLNLFHSYILYKLGVEAEAERILNSIKPADFYFLQKKVCSIIYLYLMRELKHNGKKYQDQLMSTIEETGFIRFKTILN